MKTTSKVNYDNFLADFNLYLCEWFAERDAAQFNHISNGMIFTAKTKDFDLYIRLWEHSGGLGLPDGTVIIARAIFSKDEQRNFENLLQFLKMYAPLYAFTNIAIEFPPINGVGYLSRYGFAASDNSLASKWHYTTFESLQVSSKM